MNSIFYFLTLTFFFSGCGGIYSSLESLKDTKANDGTVYTYTKDFKLVEKKVENFLMQCYNKEKPIVSTDVYAAGLFIPIEFEGISTFCRKQNIKDGTLYYVTIANKYYTIGAEVTAINSTNTLLKLYSSNFVWGNGFSNLDEYIEGGKLNCPKL